MDFFSILTLLGGLAMFLYGMQVMGDGLAKVSGGKLEQILENLTSSKWKAVLLGMCVTAVIQSSSATTVMVVGFVNSGIMKLTQAVGIIMGANIGTTITSWILSLTGIESSNFFISLLKPSAFSPILALIGIVLLTFTKSSRKKDVGTILLGFAVLMFGMESMSGAVKPLADVPEFTGLLLIKAYHKSRGDEKRKKIIVPDSAHGTNPASAAMAGFQVVSIESAPDGGVDLEKLQEVCGEDTAGLMLTNPNTVGLFDKNILKITEIVHNCGGLCYYDGANLNAVMGTVRPGDMGFDVIHLNLHKTFSTPHGGGGPGSGPVGCKSMLVPFLPSYVVDGEEELKFVKEPQSIGEMKSFYGNFTVIVKALTYVKTLGREGIPEASQNAVLNANYMMNKLKDLYTMAYDEVCMHEFVMSLADLKKKTGISAMDIAKGLLDNGIHPPTMYFPLIVEEALMVEPTETESKETLDEAVEVLRKLYEIAETDAEQLHQAPVTTPVTRMDEVGAARHPYLRYEWQD